MYRRSVQAPDRLRAFEREDAKAHFRRIEDFDFGGKLSVSGQARNNIKQSVGSGRTTLNGMIGLSKTEITA
jgi:hypothetical protein